MRVVITGASGNVGTALLRRFAQSTNEYDVVGVVRRPPEPIGVYKQVQWFGLDLASPQAGDHLREVFSGADAVVHLAWGFQPTRAVDYLTRVGVGGTTAVLEAAHASAVGQLVHMSSVGTYAAGSYGRRVDESWPTTGVPASAYSRDKSAAEAVLNDFERRDGAQGIAIARMRPGFIVQRAAASGLMRYGLPGYLPMGIVPMLPVLPVDRGLCIPLIHADDVADAIVRVVDQKASGAFNLAGEPPLGRDDIAQALGARGVHVPVGVLGALVDISWRARLQPLDRGWLDLAFAAPLLDCTRARSELGWSPTWSSRDALTDLLEGVASSAHGDSAPLRNRSVVDLLYRNVTKGLISSRQMP